MLPLLFLLFIPFSHFSVAMAESNAKAMFVFGDSIVDSGNNDFLDTTSKANFYPYGVDFPGGATGRFTNGRNPADVLVQLLGLPHFLPVFYDPRTKGSAILSGVNYATAGSGILVSTSQITNVTSLGEQVTNFINYTLPELASQVNESGDLASYLSHSIFLVNSGGVDLSRDCSVSAFAKCLSLADTLLGNFTQQLERLYNFGARKFVVFNLMPSGSNIFFKTKNNGSAEDFLNEADSYLNHQLKYALDGMSREKHGFSFVYVDIFHMVMSMLDDPTAYGLKVTKDSCCTLSATSDYSACAEGVAPCSERSIYLFYDAMHPTESVYVQLSTKAFFSKLDAEVYPFNVNILANLTLDIGASSNVQPWSDA